MVVLEKMVFFVEVFFFETKRRGYQTRESLQT